MSFPRLGSALRERAHTPTRRPIIFLELIINRKRLAFVCRRERTHCALASIMMTMMINTQCDSNENATQRLRSNYGRMSKKKNVESSRLSRDGHQVEERN